MLLAAGQERADRGDPTGSVHLFAQCERRGKCISDVNTRAKVLGAAAGASGSAYAALGQFDDAISQYQQALQICRQAGDRSAEAMRLNNLGVVYCRKRDFAQAQAHYKEALDVADAQGDHVHASQIRSNIQLISTDKGRGSRAWKVQKSSKAKPLSTSSARRNLCAV